jgi:hypothetical protein
VITVIDLAIERAVVKRATASASMARCFVNEDARPSTRKAYGCGEAGKAGADDMDCRPRQVITDFKGGAKP